MLASLISMLSTAMTHSPSLGVHPQEPQRLYGSKTLHLGVGSGNWGLRLGNREEAKVSAAAAAPASQVLTDQQACPFS